MPDPRVPDPVIAGVLRRPFAEQVAFFRGKLGNLVPTRVWTDMLRSAHDQGFMVAGAQSADLLSDLAAAVDRAIAEGVSLDTFREDFREIVAHHGWAYHGEENWRTRTIYRTNMATSYAAGREAQLAEAEFPYLIYFHGGSAEPRPQHLAWDGLVLPADHPFWATHSPPNGWGCSCRKVGVRSLEAARRLGADPDKTLPPGWDARNEKTGAPQGIDAGWDYRPGETVTDAVRQMAAKTQQWEYTLAKAYMQNVPAAQRDALAQAYRALPSVARDVRLYAQRILEGRKNLQVPKYKTLGLATRAHVSVVSRLKGIDVSGYDFAIDRYVPLHVLNRHGKSDSEAPRGQRPVVAADYARLPALLNAPDRITDSGTAKKTGMQLITAERVFAGELYRAVWEVRPKRKMLVLKSFWIGKPGRKKP